MTDYPSQNLVLDGTLVSKLRADIEDVFHVDRVELPRELPPGIAWLPRGRRRAATSAPSGIIFFIGTLLRQDSEEVYDLIAERWQAHDYTPLLRRYKGEIALIARPGVVTPKPANPWVNLVLALVTIFSVLLTGATYECQCFPPTTLSEWLGGLPMMLTMMVILLAHEFGHYFAARHHKVAVTLPYFIPLPVISPVGTLGAFIQLRTPFKTKKQLFDIGIAGPLGGLIFAIPLVFWGVATSPVNEITRGETSLLEGNSVFYLLVKYLMHGQLLPNFDQYANLPFWQESLLLLVGLIPAGGGTDILMNSVAFAAWFGLFVTAMNLMPVGQLDGGHLIYCILGQRARWLGAALVAAMFLAGVFWWSGWFVWAMLIFFIIGTGHPPPLNDLVELGPTRKLAAYLTLVVFFLLFMPNPLQPM
ncbi:MAG: site-2 protease family protein [Anaerolineae bacterium]|nr:site-2 protease family protein [Anaerolineae bacterium]